jgi:hypothetical protein
MCEQNVREACLTLVDKFEIYKSCLGELVEPNALQETRLRQAANDTYHKTLTFKLLSCKVELVETEFIEAHPSSTS